MKIAHELVPPNGWVFIQGNITIEGDHFDDLVQNVRHHRVSNMIPFGNLEQEIENQIGKRFPQLVIQAGD